MFYLRAICEPVQHYGTQLPPQHAITWVRSLVVCHWEALCKL